MLVAGIIIGLTLILLGIIGSVLPILPWPQLAYIGILIFHFMAGRPFSLAFLLVWLVIMVALVVLDQFLPVLSTKKFWGSKRGMRGSGIWAILGIFGGVFGILIGPFAWALLGEWRHSRNWKKSLKPALWSFIGIAMSGLIKIAICLVLAWSLIAKAIEISS